MPLPIAAAATTIKFARAFAHPRHNAQASTDRTHWALPAALRHLPSRPHSVHPAMQAQHRRHRLEITKRCVTAPGFTGGFDSKLLACSPFPVLGNRLWNKVSMRPFGAYFTGLWSGYGDYMYESIWRTVQCQPSRKHNYCDHWSLNFPTLSMDS